MNVTQILTFLANIVGELTTSSSIGATISFLIQIVTFATQEIQAITPEIKAIIAALQSNAAITADQMTQLQALDAQVDAAFEAAAAADNIPSDPSTVTS